MAGYSGTPLAKKLGIRSGMSVHVHQPPDHYFEWLSPLPDNLHIIKTLRTEIDFIHLFVKDQTSLKKEFAHAKKYLLKNGMIWVSWPKKSAKVNTDLGEHIIRATGLKEGLVDVKVCAVDETWSGLKFVFRLEDR